MSTDYRTIRAAALAYAVAAAEAAHEWAVNVYGAAAPTREAAIVAVLDEATAYWAVETRAETCAAATAMDVADDLRTFVDEQAVSIVGVLARAATR